MDKGIRPYIIRRFLEQLPTRAGSTDRVTNTNFRKSLIAELMEQFGITLASAATQYNEAFKNAREVAKTNQEVAAQLVGLGRPEDKKGGRKRKVVPTEAATGSETASTETATGDEATATAGEVEDDVFSTDGETVEQDPPPAEQTVFTVMRKKDNTVVAEGLSFDAAKELINAAKAAKKAALYWV